MKKTRLLYVSFRTYEVKRYRRNQGLLYSEINSTATLPFLSFEYGIFFCHPKGGSLLSLLRTKREETLWTTEAGSNRRLERMHKAKGSKLRASLDVMT